MKTKGLFFWLLSFLPLLAALVSLVLLPDQIPAHYGIDGQVTRWGSKLEVLIYPAIIIAFCGFWLLMFRVERRSKTHTKQNQRVLHITSLATLGLFNLLFALSLRNAFAQTENIYVGDAYNMMQILAISIGVLLIIIGNYLPKCKQNHLIGIRLKWTLENETVWYKTHRLGGTLMLFLGGALIALNLFVSDANVALVSILASSLLVAVILIVYSFVQYQKLK